MTSMHVTKVYFIQLVLKIKYIEFDDNSNFFTKKTWECESFCARRLTKEHPAKKIGKYEHWTTFCESYEQPVQSNALWWLTLKCAVYTWF